MEILHALIWHTVNVFKERVRYFATVYFATEELSPARTNIMRTAQLLGTGSSRVRKDLKIDRLISDIGRMIAADSTERRDRAKSRRQISSIN